MLKTIRSGGALALAGVLTFVACQREETFPDLGLRVASPVDVEVSDDGQYFYVLNADMDRTYNRGSVLVLGQDGEKLAAAPVPRMGRVLKVAGSDMIAAVDVQDDASTSEAILFDLTDRAKPVEVKRFPLGCSPLGIEMRPGYRHFAVTCTGGQLFIGTLADDRAQSTLKLVRNYGASRRALHIDPARNLLFAFTTDLDRQSASDSPERDVATFDDNGQEVKGPNGESIPDEIPDQRQNSRRALSNKGQWQLYQFVVYDLAAEREPSGCTPTETEDCVFPWRTRIDPVVEKELRWIYFKLANFDGTPDPMTPSDLRGPAYKYYRTNFWQARPDLHDPDVFYLSHRGPPRSTGSPHANQVVRVRIVGDLRAETEAGRPLFTEDVLQFERVYGFNGAEVSPLHYPGDFEVAEVAGQSLLLVNHFRDLVNWQREDIYFSLAAKVLDENTWVAETTGNTDPGNRSWYQVAVNNQGRAASCLFYSNAVMLLDVTPGVGISDYKRIE